MREGRVGERFCFGKNDSIARVETDVVIISKIGRVLAGQRESSEDDAQG